MLHDSDGAAGNVHNNLHMAIDQVGGLPLAEAGARFSSVTPTTCPAFSLLLLMDNGLTLGARLRRDFHAVAEFSAQRAGNINSTGEDLTLFSYLFGPRYTLRKSDRSAPFGQVLLGGAHASGTFEPSLAGGSGSFNSFSMVAGGGLDISLNSHIGFRAFEETLLT